MRCLELNACVPLGATEPDSKHSANLTDIGKTRLVISVGADRHDCCM